MARNQTRSTAEVFEDHLRLRQQHNVEEDIARNYAADVVILTLEGVFYGHGGVRHTSHILHELLPGEHYHYLKKQVAEEYACLEWSGTSSRGGAEVQHGADGYAIRDGRIVAQMIHYYLADHA